MADEITRLRAENAELAKMFSQLNARKKELNDELTEWETTMRDMNKVAREQAATIAELTAALEAIVVEPDEAFHQAIASAALARVQP